MARLKMTEEHYQKIKAGVQEAKDKVIRLEDWSDTSYRWALYWYVVDNVVGTQWDIDNLSYLNDNHIDSALRKIVKEIGA